ncbi:MAG: hypothetical protein M1423_11170, partial [Acidobacteria bacterium]|nr:hypothetical protein [Acidobacteriota bacterium]
LSDSLSLPESLIYAKNIRRKLKAGVIGSRTKLFGSAAPHNRGVKRKTSITQLGAQYAVNLIFRHGINFDAEGRCYGSKLPTAAVGADACN